MKSLAVATIVSVSLVVAVGASQTGESGAQKPAQKKPGTHSMTGCLEKGTDANTFRLTNVEGKVKTVEIVEVASATNLTPHVGHKVTITGAAISPGQTQKSGAATAKSVAGEHRMRVDQVKHVSPTCP
jgi:hypothetical protein